MSSQRYERVNAHDEDDSPIIAAPHSNTVPTSPPPSFRSRASSPTTRQLLSEHDPLVSDADRTLANTFDSPSDDEGDDDDRDHGDDRQRLMRRGSGENVSLQGDQVVQVAPPPRGSMQRRVTELPVFVPQAGAGAGARVMGGGNMVNDGVFANLSAKPTRGGDADLDEKPPTYEQAAADATPPYWETTILAPGMVSDEVFVDGLPVGSVFSFAWNCMISVVFQAPGFLLAYLLHTTHAAKNGSLSGLGIILVQLGFSFKGSAVDKAPPADGPEDMGPPPDPNAHDFNPDAGGAGAAGAVAVGLTKWDWFAYILMIVGWFIIIRAVSDFLRARKHEQLVLQSPDRGLGVPVVAEGERPETSV